MSSVHPVYLASSSTPVLQVPSCPAPLPAAVCVVPTVCCLLTREKRSGFPGDSLHPTLKAPVAEAPPGLKDGRRRCYLWTVEGADSHGREQSCPFSKSWQPSPAVGRLVPEGPPVLCAWGQKLCWVRSRGQASWRDRVWMVSICGKLPKQGPFITPACFPVAPSGTGKWDEPKKLSPGFHAGHMALKRAHISGCVHTHSG